MVKRLGLPRILLQWKKKTVPSLTSANVAAGELTAVLRGSSLMASKPDGDSQAQSFYSKHKKKLNPSNTSELPGPNQHAQCSFQFRCLNLACMNHPRVNLYPHLMCELCIFWTSKRQVLEGEADLWLQVWVIQSVLSYRAGRVFKTCYHQTPLLSDCIPL